VNTFAHSSIKLKILSAVILAVLIQAISVGYAINSLERVNFDLNRVVVEQVEKVKLAARMHRNLEEMRVAEKGVLLSTSKEEREQYLGVIKSASGMVQQRSGQLRDLIDKDGKGTSTGFGQITIVTLCCSRIYPNWPPPRTQTQL
jgi:hypothetical protein